MDARLTIMENISPREGIYRLRGEPPREAVDTAIRISD